jgi:tyrosyl-tRNA synthetase
MEQPNSNQNSLSINPLTGGLYYKTHARRNIVEKEVNDINPYFNPEPCSLSNQERFDLIKSVGHECVNDEDLREALEHKRYLYAYDGFEPSGRMHIAQGVMKAINVNRLVDAGCIFIFWVADWFALLNDKMGGDLEKIRVVGHYFVEIWKAVGMKMSNVKFLWASDSINGRADSYWMRVIDIARKSTTNRIKKCCTIMGKSSEESLSMGQMLYPCMQCADIFHMELDICQLGLDQRKVNMLARDYCKKDAELKEKVPPIILSSVMIPGLKKGQYKMSKSDPDSAIFMEDTAEDVARKLRGAYCPEKETTENPCLDYARYFVLNYFGEFVVERSEDFGGNKTYTTYEDLESDFKEGLLHPGDLKNALILGMNKILQPVRDHFTNDAYARGLLKKIKKYQEEMRILKEMNKAKK